MEFMNRGTGRPQQNVNPVQANSTNDSSPNRSNRLNGLRSMKIASVVLLFSVTILIVALVSFLALQRNTDEKDYVANDKMQAVFLNGGQVYFGKIINLNEKYIRMTGIFYLRVNQTVQPKDEEQQAAQNNISLVKLGCELHRPDSEMLINRDQVVFWENLKDDSGENTVPGAVKKYNEQYPNGQECEDAEKQQSSSSSPTNSLNDGQDNTSDNTSSDQ